jgi:hypothetical protein
MKSFLIILALCASDGTACTPNRDAATIYEYDRLAECVQAEHWFSTAYGVEAICASRETSPADLTKG